MACFVVLTSPSTDHPCPCQGILWSRAQGLNAQVRALSAVHGQLSTLHSGNFPLRTARPLLREDWRCLGETSYFGDATVGQGHTGIWHESLVEQQAACKEAAARHPKAKALRAKRQELGLPLPPCLDMKAQSCSSIFSLPPCVFLFPKLQCRWHSQPGNR